MIEKGPYSVKSVTRYEDCTLHKDNKKIADASWSECGGPFDVWWKTEDDKEDMQSWLSVIAEQTGNPIYDDPDDFVDAMMHESANVTYAKKMKAKRSCFKLKSEDLEDDIRYLETSYSDAVVLQLKKKYGQELEYIYNEEFDFFPKGVDRVINLEDE